MKTSKFLLKFLLLGLFLFTSVVCRSMPETIDGYFVGKAWTSSHSSPSTPGHVSWEAKKVRNHRTGLTSSSQSLPGKRRMRRVNFFVIGLLSQTHECVSDLHPDWIAWKLPVYETPYSRIFTPPI